MTSRRRTTVLTALLALATTSVQHAAHAQRFTVTVLGAAGNPRSTVVLPEGMERVAGVWPGAVVELTLNRFALTVHGFRGQMSPIEGTVALDRDAGEIGGLLRIGVLPLVAIEGGFTVRTFTTASGYQEWLIPSIGLALFTTLGHEAITAHLRVAYLPSIVVKFIEAGPDFGIAAAAGLTIALPGTPLVFRAEYSFERYEFPETSPSGDPLMRLEQFDQVIVGLGFSFGTRQR